MTPIRSSAELVFVAFNSRIAALRKDTGETVWHWKSPRGSGFVAVLLDGERLIASIDGFTWCFEAQTGRVLWENLLTGFGYGVPCLASSDGHTIMSAIQHQQNIQASS